LTAQHVAERGVDAGVGRSAFLGLLQPALRLLEVSGVHFQDAESGHQQGALAVLLLEVRDGAFEIGRRGFGVVGEEADVGLGRDDVRVLPACGFRFFKVLARRLLRAIAFPVLAPAQRVGVGEVRVGREQLGVELSHDLFAELAGLQVSGVAVAGQLVSGLLEQSVDLLVALGRRLLVEVVADEPAGSQHEQGDGGDEARRALLRRGFVGRVAILGSEVFVRNRRLDRTGLRFGLRILPRRLGVCLSPFGPMARRLGGWMRRCDHGAG